MRILFVHEVSWFKKVVFEMHDIPELLSLRGHDVYFLDFDEGRPRTKLRVISTIESRAHSGSKVSVVSPPKLFPGLLGRLVATLIQPLTFLWLVKKIRPDVVVTYSVPTSGWQITRICNACSIPIVARIIDVPHALRRTPFTPLIQLAERFVFSNVNFLSTHNFALLEYCIKRGADIRKSSVICPGVDLVRFSTGKSRSGRLRHLGIEPEDKVLLFMGTIFRFSGLFELVSELAPALQNDPSIKLIVLGDGEDLERLTSLVQGLKLDRGVLLLGRIEYCDLAEYIRLADVALVPFNQELVTHCALPAKVLQYLACGLPTLATPLKGLVSIVGDGNGVIYTDNLNDMASKSLGLLCDEVSLARLASQGRAFVEKVCSWSKQIDLFEEMLISQVSNA